MQSLYCQMRSVLQFVLALLQLPTLSRLKDTQWVLKAKEIRQTTQVLSWPKHQMHRVRTSSTCKSCVSCFIKLIRLPKVVRIVGFGSLIIFVANVCFLMQRDWQSKTFIVTAVDFVAREVEKTSLTAISAMRAYFQSPCKIIDIWSRHLIILVRFAKKTIFLLASPLQFICNAVTLCIKTVFVSLPSTNISVHSAKSHLWTCSNMIDNSITKLKPHQCLKIYEIEKCLSCATTASRKLGVIFMF